MKRILLITVLLSLCLSSFANEDNGQNTAAKGNKALENSKQFSHWSVSVGGGANISLSDYKAFAKLSHGSYLNKNTNWGVNFQCEYMINPIWGIMFEYMYAPQNKKALNYLDERFQMNPSINTNKDFQMHEFSFNLVFNVLNLVDRSRYRTDWNFFMGIGAGILNYENYKHKSVEHVFRNAAVIPVSLSVEYSPISSIGIFAETQYRWYSKDDINCIEYDNMQDMSLYAGLGIRYHIAATKKPHVHLISVDTYKPVKSQPVNANNEDIDELKSKINFLTEQINKANTEIANLGRENRSNAHETDPATAQRINKLEETVNNILNNKEGNEGNIQKTDPATAQRINKLEETVNNILNNKEGNEGNVQKTDHATAQRIYELEKKMQDLINDKRSNGNNTGNIMSSESYIIYFDFNSSEISSVYNIDLMKIAQRMASNQKLKIRITGYCDSKGTDDNNKIIGQRRIDSVINVLVNKYKIANDRIVTENIGKPSNENETDELSRRVEIEFIH